MSEQLVTTDASGKLRVPFARLGAWVHPKYGLVKFSQSDFDAIKTNFANDEAGFPPYLTLGHLKNPKASDGEPAEAILEEIVQDGDVLAGIFDPNTPEVVKAVEEKKYRFSSAELFRKMVSKTTGEPIGPMLTAVALTNAPFVPNLPAAEVLSSSIAEDSFFQLNLSMGEAEDEAVDLVDALEELSMDEAEEEEDERTMMRSLLTSMNTLVEMARGFFTAKKIEAVADAAVEQIREEKYEQIEAAYEEAHAKADPAHKAAEAAREAAYAVENQAYAEANAKADAATAAANEQIEALEEAKRDAMLALSQGQEVSDAAGGSEADSAVNGTSSTDKHTEAVPSSSPTKEAGETMENELEKAQAEMQAKLEAMSSKLAEAEAANKDLVEKLSATAETAEQLSNKLLEKDLEAKRDALVGEGVPPVMADMALSIAKAAGEQKLSIGGEDVSLSEQIFALLKQLPAEQRVDLSQHGGASEQSADDVDLYGDIVNNRFGQ